MLSELPIMAIAPAYASREGRSLVPAPMPRTSEGATTFGVVEITGVLYKPKLVALREQVIRLATNPRVGEILLLVDSPGGTVAGTHDLYAAISRAAKVKRVTAFVEDHALSGAMYAIAGASEIVMNHTGHAGSIGVYTVLADASRYFEKLGVDIIVVRAGAHKGAGEYGAKITGEQIAQVQAVIDELGRHFVAAVAKGRWMSVERVNDLADGRVLVGNQAKAAGLVDRLAHWEDIVDEVAQRTEYISYASAFAKFNKLVAAEAEEIRSRGIEGRNVESVARAEVRERHPKVAAAAEKYERTRARH